MNVNPLHTFTYSIKTHEKSQAPALDNPKSKGHATSRAAITINDTTHLIALHSLKQYVGLKESLVDKLLETFGLRRWVYIPANSPSDGDNSTYLRVNKESLRKRFGFTNQEMKEIKKNPDKFHDLGAAKTEKPSDQTIIKPNEPEQVEQPNEPEQVEQPKEPEPSDQTRIKPNEPELNEDQKSLPIDEKLKKRNERHRDHIFNNLIIPQPFVYTKPVSEDMEKLLEKATTFTKSFDKSDKTLQSNIRIEDVSDKQSYFLLKDGRFHPAKAEKNGERLKIIITNTNGIVNAISYKIDNTTEVLKTLFSESSLNNQFKE